MVFGGAATGCVTGNFDGEAAGVTVSEGFLTGVLSAELGSE